MIGDVVVVGAALVSGGAPPSPENSPSPVRGYDTRTGELLWTFHTIPREGEFGNDTWEDDSWRTTGNGGVWSWMSADPELGLVYLPTEAGTGDYYGGPPPRRQPLHSERLSPSKRLPASAAGTTRPSTTGSGTTTTPPARYFST